MQIWRVQAEVGREKQSLVMLDPGCVMMSGACYQVYSHHVGIWVLSLNTALSCPCEVKGMQERATMLTVGWESEGDIAFHCALGDRLIPLACDGKGVQLRICRLPCLPCHKECSSITRKLIPWSATVSA